MAEAAATVRARRATSRRHEEVPRSILEHSRHGPIAIVAGTEIAGRTGITRSLAPGHGARQSEVLMAVGGVGHAPLCRSSAEFGHTVG